MLSAATREQIALAAVEEERARLARELHDDSLQVLAGVIQRLGRQPGTEAEREALRALAARLRAIATELHPPALVDLGLVPALEALADGGDWPDVAVEIASAGSAPRERPPLDVELAAYRVVREAVANAVAHSGAGAVDVRGRVHRREVALEIVDHGAGFDATDVERAMREGHLGVASMRRRAEAIDAHLVVTSVPGRGTTVSLRWSG